MGGVVGARLSGSLASIDGLTLKVGSSGMLGGNPHERFESVGELTRKKDGESEGGEC